MNLFIDLPEKFHFERTVNSHGWRSLAPFSFDDASQTLSYVFSNGELPAPIRASIGEADGKLKIEAANIEKNKAAQAKIVRDVRHILRLDEDLSQFYKLIKKEKDFAWIARQNAGRLLRSPTVFEDLVKTICTTNCSWSLTKKMVTNLVEKLGEASVNGGGRAFPTPEKMAQASAEFYREEIRCGYRAAYFAELAGRVAGGKLDPENWLNADLSTSELKREMKIVKGVGNYAAENLLKLVGRYDGLALDSYLRAQFYKNRNSKTVCADCEIEKFYEPFGEWKGLAIWCDMTKK